MKPPIYVVDDNEDVRETLSELLATVLDIPVESYSNGADFLSAAEPRACLILDLGMPGLSGRDVLRELEERSLEIPTVLISGHIVEPNPGEDWPSFVEALLPKPYSIEELTGLVKKLLLAFESQAEDSTSGSG